MGNYLSGVVVGFREGLEAFLIVVIMLRFLRKTGRAELCKSVGLGAVIGVLLSLLVGGGLYALSSAVGKLDQAAKLWESGASLAALGLITTFIVWMIRHGSDMVRTVEQDTARNLSRSGVLLISALMVAREGVEIAIFSFAGEYELPAIFLGTGAALILTVLIYFSLVNVNLKTIFNLTLLYLILQAGFLLGYGIHEGLEALEQMGVLAESSGLLLGAVWCCRLHVQRNSDDPKTQRSLFQWALWRRRALSNAPQNDRIRRAVSTRPGRSASERESSASDSFSRCRSGPKFR